MLNLFNKKSDLIEEEITSGLFCAFLEPTFMFI